MPDRHAAALVNGYGELWDDYLAVHRSGVSNSDWENAADGNDRTKKEKPSAFNLISIVAYTWAVRVHSRVEL
jgi:hypothetical protein